MTVHYVLLVFILNYWCTAKLASWLFSVAILFCLLQLFCFIIIDVFFIGVLFFNNWSSSIWGLVSNKLRHRMFPWLGSRFEKSRGILLLVWKWQFLLTKCIVTCLLIKKIRPLRNTCCCHPYTHIHTRLTALFPGLPGWAGTRKVKPIWILLK